jgi:ABC transport system ATP-binding/permease protein
MAFLLGCEKVRVEFPTKTVFEDISLGVDDGARIGIVGRNGDGKSTLLSLLSGALEPDEGRAIRTRDVSVGVLSQTDDLDDNATVHISVVGDRPEYEWAGDSDIRSIIDGLISDIPWEGRVGELSGGQRRRVDLARLLVGKWDVIMLDEPTNHLDVRAINWLAQHLKRRWRAGQGALLVVTHDRWFLDEVCLNMWEVHDGIIEPFEGGFSAYIMQRVERERVARVTEERRQNKLRRELAWLSRGARARSTKPKFHVKAAQELIADVPPLRNTLELQRMAVARLGKECIDLENVAVRYEGSDKLVFQDVTWNIGPGDRVGILGENGAGKTTLLRTIEGLIQPVRGRVKIGKTVKIAVLSQHLENLTSLGTDRVRQVAGRYTSRVMLDGKEQTPGDLLERLGFSKADLNEPVCDLSGGQKRRLALMLILLDQPNVLILDEPGNDLDVDMLAAVEDLLDGWPGTLVLVTHDRYLMERVTDNQYALIGGRVRHLPGGVDEYLALEAEHHVATAAAKDLAQAAADAAKPVDGGLSNNELRALKKTISSTERKMHTLEGKIEDAKQAMFEVDPTDFVKLGEAQQAIDELRVQLEELELAWLEANEKLEG